MNTAGFYGGLNVTIIDYTNFRRATTDSVIARGIGPLLFGEFNQGLTGLSFATTDVNHFIQDDIRVTALNG